MIRRERSTGDGEEPGYYILAWTFLKAPILSLDLSEYLSESIKHTLINAAYALAMSFTRCG